MTTLNTQDPYLNYYKHQLGSGVSVVYKGVPYQRGHGIGSFLGGLFRTISPLLKSGAKTVGQEAFKTGINLLTDVIGAAVPPEQAFGARMKEFTTNLKRRADAKVDNVMGGSGYKRKRPRVTTQSLKRLLAVKTTVKSKRSKKKKEVSKDIFS